MSLNDQFDHFTISYIEDLLDRLIIDESKIFLIQKDKSAIQPLAPGFGVGFSGIYYFFRLASVYFAKKNSSLSERIQIHFKKFNQIQFLKNCLDKINGTEFFPISHGFNSGVVGLLLANKPIDGSFGQSQTLLADLLEAISLYYCNVDIAKLNHTFYGGTSGLIFGLAHAKKNVPGHYQSTEIVLRSADELAKIANSGEFEKFLALVQIPTTMVGLSWGTSGIIMALSIATQYENKSEYQSAIRLLIEYEDQFIDTATKKRTNLAIKNEDRSVTWNPLCYGSTGILLSRKDRSSHIHFDQQRTHSDIEEVRSLDLNNLGMEEAQKISFCCGVGGMMEALSEYPKAENEAHVDMMLEFLIQHLLKQQTEKWGDHFLQGLTGILYIAMKNQYKISDSLWKTK